MARIDQIRKDNMTVRVLDAKGRAIRGAEVQVRIKRHAFGFGSTVTAYDLTSSIEDGRRYRTIIERSFNKVVLENDLKWGPWGIAEQRKVGEFYNIDNTFQALRWLKERGIQVRGHYVAWGPLAADGGTTSNAEKHGAKFRDALLDHAEQKVKRVGDLVSEWDVVNHPVGWGTKTIQDIAGGDIYDVVFQRMAGWSPKPARYINEGGILRDSGKGKANERYYTLIAEMLARGVPIQGIGFMGHFFAEKDLTPPEKLLEVLDRYAAFGLPLQVTEFDVRYGKNMGESITLTAEQEQLQADYTRDFLIAMYSHPSVVGVVMWGFWEGRHWYPSAALYRKDWSIKPNGRVWEDLVLRQWRTDASGSTDANGAFSVRAFHGDYEIEVAHGGKSKKLKGIAVGPAGTSVQVVLEGEGR